MASPGGRLPDPSGWAPGPGSAKSDLGWGLPALHPAWQVKAPGPTLFAMLVATWVTAIATFGLLVGALVTAVYAGKAFSTQKRELKLMELQRADQRGLTVQQIDLLQVQADAIRRQERQRRALEPDAAATLERFLREGRLNEDDGAEPADALGPPLLPGLGAGLGFAAQPPPEPMLFWDDQQARHVLAWQEREPLPGPGKDPAMLVRVHVQNRSTEPVSDLQFQLYIDSEPAVPYRVPVLPPQSTETRDITLGRGLSERAAVTVTFRDAAGNRWLRNPASGDLTPLPDDAEETRETGADRGNSP